MYVFLQTRVYGPFLRLSLLLTTTEIPSVRSTACWQRSGIHARIPIAVQTTSGRRSSRKTLMFVMWRCTCAPTAVSCNTFFVSWHNCKLEQIFVIINRWKGKPSGSLACTRKQQPRFYWSRSSVVMHDASPLTPPNAWAELKSCSRQKCC